MEQRVRDGARWGRRGRVRLALVAGSILAAAGLGAAGEVSVDYGETRNPQYQRWRSELVENEVLEDIAADLNESILWPEDLTISFSECGRVNAFYDPNAREIHICYELLQNFYQLFPEAADTQEEVDTMVANAKDSMRRITEPVSP